MIYLLDTSAVVALLRNRPPAVRERLRQTKARGGQIAVSSVALFELWYGVARSQQRALNAERLQLFLSGDLAAIDFDAQDASLAGELRRTLEAAGTPIGAYDLLIAAQALRAGATLVTANTVEFARVQELACEDWSALAPT